MGGNKGKKAATGVPKLPGLGSGSGAGGRGSSATTTATKNTSLHDDIKALLKLSEAQFAASKKAGGKNKKKKQEDLETAAAAAPSSPAHASAKQAKNASAPAASASKDPKKVIPGKANASASSKKSGSGPAASDKNAKVNDPKKNAVSAGTGSTKSSLVSKGSTDSTSKPSSKKIQVLRAEILALGGTEDDLELIEDVISDSEDETGAAKTRGKAAAVTVDDGDVLAELKGFMLANKIDPSKSAVPIASDDEEDDEGSDDESGYGEDSDESMLEQPLGRDTSKTAKPTPATMPPKLQNRLLIAPLPVWHATRLLPIPDVASYTPADEPRIQLAFANAKLLFDRELELYNNPTKAAEKSRSAPSSSERKFISTVLKSGTTTDKVSAIILMVQESPLHTLPLLRDQLVHGMAQAKARREAMLAVDALKDLIIGGSLLPDVRLKYFRDRPLFSSDVTERHLIMWYFEDQLKKLYFEFLQLLEELSKDPLSYVKSKALFYICELLVAKPEQEANLLSLLINKLGDTDGKVASKASFLLVSNVLVKHPAMKLVVVKDIERFLFRSAVGSRARLTALGTLSQIPLSNRDADVAVAGYLVSVYFAFFDILVKGAKTTAAAKHEKFNRQQQEHAAEKKKGKQPTAADIETATISAASAIGGIDARMMASLLTGINRAFPYANLSPSVFAAHMDALFAACHAASSEASFNVSIQALTLIFQCVIHHGSAGTDQGAPVTEPSASSAPGTPSAEVAKIYATLTNRFYRVLYDTLTDRRLATATSRLPAYFNLLHRALRADVSDARAKAFTKRILQATVSGMVAGASASFACAALFLIGDLARRRPGIWALVTQPEELSDGKDGGYDPRKREPLFCKAEESCLWELVALSRHYHPTVSLFARTLLSSKPIEAPRSATAYDPLQNHTLARFLDRFVYKNPKQVSAVLHRGSSIMQARPPTAKDEDEDFAYADDEERFVAAGKKKSVVVLEDGQKTRMDDHPVGSYRWMIKKKQNIPADEQFFYEFFHSKRVEEQQLKRVGATQGFAEGNDEDYDADKGPRRGRVAEAPGGGDADDVDGDDDAESLDEDEIWEAMQRSVGFPTKGDKEDDDGGDDDDADDDVDLAALAEAMGSDADGDDGDEDAEEADFAADGADNGAEIVDDGDDAWEDDDDEDSFAALDGLDDDDDEDGTGQASAPAPADADAKPRQPPRKLRQLARTAAALGYKGDYFTRRHRAGGDGDDSDDGGGGAGGAAGPFAAMDEFETLIDRADEDEGGGGGGGASGEDDDDGDDGDGLVDFLMDGDDDDDVGGGRGGIAGRAGGVKRKRGADGPGGGRKRAKGADGGAPKKAMGAQPAAEIVPPSDAPSLPPSARLHLSTLAKLSAVLRLDPIAPSTSPSARACHHAPLSTSAFLAALSDVQIAAAKAKCEEARVKEAAAAAARWREELERVEGALARFIASSDEGYARDAPQLADMLHTTRLMEEKGAEYVERLDALREVVTDDMCAARFAEVEAMEASAAAMEREADAREREVAAFADLPADLALATIKLEEKRQELRRLAQRRNDLLQGMARGIAG